MVGPEKKMKKWFWMKFQYISFNSLFSFKTTLWSKRNRPKGFIINFHWFFEFLKIKSDFEWKFIQKIRILIFQFSLKNQWKNNPLKKKRKNDVLKNQFWSKVDLS